MKQKTIPELRELLKGKPLAQVPVVFSYLGQYGQLKNDKEFYRFPLWPTQDLPPIVRFSLDQGVAFWLLVSQHWLHQSFLDEAARVGDTYYGGFICMRCRCRAIVPIHTYASVVLQGPALRGYRRIRSRQAVFEIHREFQLGLDIPDVTARAIARQTQDDPILDAWGPNFEKVQADAPKLQPVSA